MTAMLRYVVSAVTLEHVYGNDFTVARGVRAFSIR